MTAINMKLSKLLENLFKGIKSDAIPRSPRNADETTPEAHNENVELPDEQEPEIVIESVSDDEIKKEKKSKKKKFFKSKKQDYNVEDDEDEFSKSSQEKRGSAGSVNVQGNFISPIFRVWVTSTLVPICNDDSYLYYLNFLLHTNRGFIKTHNITVRYVYYPLN